jgi:predicted nuclease with TOPRIM domain
MSEDDLKSILAKYQQKTFELFNKNIVLETQVETLTEKLNILNSELEKLKKTKKTARTDDQF